MSNYTRIYSFPVSSGEKVKIEYSPHLGNSFHQDAITGSLDRILLYRTYLHQNPDCRFLPVRDTIDFQDSEKLTPMHLAAQMGNIQFIIALIRTGSRGTEIKCRLRKLPIMYAFEQGHRECADILKVIGHPAIEVPIGPFQEYLMDRPSEESILQTRFYLYFEDSLLQKLLLHL